MRRHAPTARPTGFTLIEVMIVVAIVAILAAIALPSYNEYIRRGHRADARAGLLQAQQWLERAATATGVYPTSLPASLTWSGDGTKRYDIALAAGATNAAFTLTATPKGAQVGDKCGTYTLTHTGLRGANGVTSGAIVTECWGK
ncbi:MAG TPA: type IV pilin protein [Ottowia sp.]|jgi:type IV pilus assembly protein PilE|nr:type IV pilin protein [Burkholderiales bacterium]TXI21348.1 MAG: prepilin-type N-terminal cleavage/methylation domain-containing protein [Ottowia sp.]HNE59451.1 type IV pilin protein [Ottowia sp.]HNI83912.1 type IV pilin protein [Ottowia sp.]HNJ45516.1 type IV pilin protein [Ottowia sp.]